MLHHSSIEHLAEEDKDLIERVESAIIGLERIVFVGLSILKQCGERQGYILTVGTDHLAVGKAQLAPIISVLEAEELENVDVRLIRGRIPG